MNSNTFILSFIIVYVLISIPAMLGIGYVIDWVPEATLLQKLGGYVKEGLSNNYLLKIVISLIVALIISLFLPKRKANISR